MSPEPIRFAFRWKRPKLTRTRPADYRRFDVRLNRYPGVVIGVHVQVGRRGLGLTWGAPGRQIAGCPDCAKGVFHSRHVSVVQRAAEMAVLIEALKATRPAMPSQDESGEIGSTQ